jgi:hypothetical protein
MNLKNVTGHNIYVGTGKEQLLIAPGDVVKFKDEGFAKQLPATKLGSLVETEVEQAGIKTFGEVEEPVVEAPVKEEKVEESKKPRKGKKQ